MSQSDGGVRGASSVGDGTADGPDCVDGVLSKTAHGLATRGMKSVPVERQAERFEVNLRWLPTWRPCPGVCEASAMVCCWRGLMTWTSRAAGRPQLQLGRRMDVCWARLKTRDQTGVSLEGANVADWAAEKTTSLMALWLDMRSPLPPHPTWWSLKESAMPRHSGREQIAMERIFVKI